ncbi:odorant receptor 7a-like [Leptinotarsa decemlineata]|uniref:odorant receptor 7a-like n=1 Tax=Leptinotarsa decemlineata TaxID=7539 RepID=UPI003D30624B
MPEASIQLLVIEDQNQVFANKLKAVLYILDIYMQLTYFCFPVGFLQSQMEESAVAVSTCPWYMKNGNFAKNLIPIMKRSQQMFSIKVWGLFDVGRIGFVNLCRFTFSVYTFLKTVK